MSAIGQTTTDAGDDTLYRATWRNGAGIKTCLLKDYTVSDGMIVARTVDGDRHVWTSGADLHLQESDVDAEEVSR